MPKVYIGQDVDVRADSTLVKVFHRGQLVKVHPRQRPGGRSTDRDDLPDAVAQAGHDLANIDGDDWPPTTLRAAADLAGHHAYPHQMAAALIAAGVTQPRDETPVPAGRPARCAHCAGGGRRWSTNSTTPGCVNSSRVHLGPTVLEEMARLPAGCLIGSPVRSGNADRLVHRMADIVVFREVVDVCGG